MIAQPAIKGVQVGGLHRPMPHEDQLQLCHSTARRCILLQHQSCIRLALHALAFCAANAAHCTAQSVRHLHAIRMKLAGPTVMDLSAVIGVYWCALC